MFVKNVLPTINTKTIFDWIRKQIKIFIKTFHTIRITLVPKKDPIQIWIIWVPKNHTIQMYVEDHFIKAKVTISDVSSRSDNTLLPVQTTSLPWACVNELRILYLPDVIFISFQIKFKSFSTYLDHSTWLIKHYAITNPLLARRQHVIAS